MIESVATSSAVRIPLLFWKPGLATVPLLDISLAPSGGGAVHGSVRRPLEALDQTTAPLGRLLLPSLLPRFPRVEFYTCAYHLPPRDVDQFVDEFPQGFSHLLSVMLGFYALGADHVLGGHEFCDALAGWAATGYPDKDGRVRGVSGLQEKLAAVRDEQREIEESGGGSIHGILISAENREDVERGACRTGGPAEFSISGADGPLRICIVSTFDEALEDVFGRRLLVRYGRINSVRRIASSPRLWSAAAVLTVLLVGLGAVNARRTRDVVGVRPALTSTPGADVSLDLARDPLARSKIVVTYADGGEERLGPFEGSVTVPAVERDDDEHVTAILVGLARPGRAAGSVVRVERHGFGEWRTAYIADPWREVAGERANEIARGLRFVKSADLLPEKPGRETLACVVTDDGACLLAMLDTQGRLLGSLWHGGTVEDVEILSNPIRILGWGCANGLPTSKDDVQAWFHTQEARAAGDPFALGPQGLHERVLWCIAPARLAGRSPYAAWAAPPHSSPENEPIARFDYYCRFEPKGYRIRSVALDYPQKNAAADIVIGVTGWRLHIAPNGRIVGRDRGSTGRGAPEPNLEPVVER